MPPPVPLKCVVFDIGSRFIKAGFSGESTPRCILPYNLEQFFYHSSQLSVEKWVDILGEIFTKIFVDHLLCKPKSFRIVICEPILAPIYFREAIGIVCYDKLQVTEVSLFSSVISTMHVSGSLSGLFVDIGRLETRIVAVVEGCPIFNTLIIRSIGALSVCEEVGRLHASSSLQNSSQEVSISHNKQSSIEMECNEDMMIRTCFVRSLNDRSEPKDMIIGGCPGHQVTVKGQVRSQAAEIYFRHDDISNSANVISHSFINDDGIGDGGGIAMLVLECLSKCDINIRHLVASNVLIVGGGAMLPGFKSRLFEEVCTLVGSGDTIVNPPSPSPGAGAGTTDLSVNTIEMESKQSRLFPYYQLKGCIDKYFNLTEMASVFQPNIATWIGASIFDQLPYSQPFTMTKPEYQMHQLNDFLSLNKNRWIQNTTEAQNTEDVATSQKNKESISKGTKRLNTVGEVKCTWQANRFNEWIKMPPNGLSPSVTGEGLDMNGEIRDGDNDKHNIPATFAVAGVGVI